MDPLLILRVACVPIFQCANCGAMMLPEKIEPEHAETADEYAERMRLLTHVPLRHPHVPKCLASTKAFAWPIVFAELDEVREPTPAPE